MMFRLLKVERSEKSKSITMGLHLKKWNCKIMLLEITGSERERERERASY
jgi:hypothetical protein